MLPDVNYLDCIRARREHHECLEVTTVDGPCLLREGLDIICAGGDY